MRSLRPALPVLFLGLLAAAAAAQIGSVQRELKIGDNSGGMGNLRFTDFFGGAVAALGDVNGDGVGDLAVGASGDDDGGDTRGAIWILFLKRDGSVLSSTKISQTQGGFTDTLSDFGVFGRRLAAVGDLDGDGISELATTARLPNRLYVLFLNSLGLVKRNVLTVYSDPVFIPATQASYFESLLGNTIRVGGLAPLGDIDGDGFGDLAVGAPGDPEGGGKQTGAVWILHLTSAGTVRATQKISALHGSFGGTLDYSDAFGSALALLGDLDHDGRPELGVGSLGDHHFWVVTLQSSGRVFNQLEYGPNDYGLHLPGAPEFTVDNAYAALGDLDGDGVSEVAMGFGLHDFPGFPQDEGGFAIGFLRSDGSVHRRLAVSRFRGGFGELVGGTRFGDSFVPLGDVDGDGRPEIAVGAPQDAGTGAVWILSLAPTGVRNGSGVNPTILSYTSEPLFGAPWSVTLDCSGHASGLAFLWCSDRPSAGTFTPLGEVLLGSPPLFRLTATHASAPHTFTIPVPPPSMALLDLALSFQGAVTGAPGARLSNAVDVLVGQ